MFNIGKKQVTDNSKLIKSEIEIVHSHYIAPRFNRRVAVNSYTGVFAAAIDYNAQAAASGTIHLHSKVRNSRGQKCLYGTTQHPNSYQRDFFKGLLIDKPSSDVQYKQLDSLENFEIVQSHPVTDLFMSSNPMQSTYQFFLQIYLMLQITGDAFVFVVSNSDGTPSQLYVLQSQYVDVIPAKEGSDRLVSHYEYNRGKGKITKFEWDEIIHIKIPNPGSIWYGMGSIEKGWQAFLINKFSHEYAAALYSNHAVPSYLLINKSGQSVSKKKFFKSMKNLNRGPKKAGKVIAVDADVDIKTVAFKPADLTDTKLTTIEIASVTGCPINKLLGNDAIKANSEIQNTEWLRNTIHPLQKLVASTLTEQLLWRYGIQEADAYLSYGSPVPVDKEYELKTNSTYVKDAVLTPNEIRISLGKEPMENGNFLYFNGNELGKTVEPTSKFISPEKTISSEIKSELDTIAKEIVKLNTKQEPTPVAPPIVLNISNDTEVKED